MGELLLSGSIFCRGITTEVFLLIALLETVGVNPSILKWKSGWLITVSTTWPMSVMLYHPNTPVGPKNRVVLFLSIHIPHLLIDSATLRPQNIHSTEKRGRDARSLNMKVTFRSEFCCLIAPGVRSVSTQYLEEFCYLGISSNNVVCVLLALLFLHTFPLDDEAMVPCSLETAA